MVIESQHSLVDLQYLDPAASFAALISLFSAVEKSAGDPQDSKDPIAHWFARHFYTETP
jgi:hypothetical protein